MTLVADADALPDAETAPGPEPQAPIEPARETTEDTTPLPLMRTAVAVTPTVAAAGLALAATFRGVAPYAVAVSAGAAGVGTAAVAARRRGPIGAQAIIAGGIFAVGLLAAAAGGAGELFDIVPSVREALRARRAVRPPAEFLPGFQLLLGWLMAAAGTAATWVAVEWRRPALGVLAPLPLVVIGAVSIPTDRKLSVGVAVLVLFLLGLAALSSLSAASLAGGQRPSVSYELRRAVRALPVAAVMVVAVAAMARFDLLFPDPVYDPVRDAQRPKAVPLSDVADEVLFQVRSKSTGPWRLGLLDVYDGEAWRIPAFAESSTRRVPRDGIVGEGTPATRADFEIRALKGAVLPDLPATVALVAAGPKLAFDQRAGTVRLAEGEIRSGLRYTVTGAALPSEEQLTSLRGGVPPRLRRFVDGMPEPPAAVRELLDAAPASPPWARFDYVRRRLLETVVATGAGGPAAVPPARVADMLTGSREGNPFEIVAAQAMLARWAGVPARIGYGYDGGDVIGDDVREVRPGHGASWLEVWFPDVGWFPVLGAPLQAKASLAADGPTNRDVVVEASDEVAVRVFIPLRVEPRSLFFEQVRRVTLLVVAALVVAGLAWLAYPPVAKVVATWRRRAWAARCGPAARVEVAYAEFRDWCTDLGLPGSWATPLGFLRYVVTDDEHTELAWLVTRAVYGDLRGQVTEEDAFAAEELSRVLRRRVSAAVPLTLRALAWTSRLSRRDPYAAAARPPTRKERRDQPVDSAAA